MSKRRPMLKNRSGVAFGNERVASKERGRPFMLAVGLLGIGFLVLLVAIAYNAPNSIPGRSYYTVQAQFDNADNITPHSQVRIGGRLVGQVLEPKAQDGNAVVDLQIDPAYGPLPSDSRVEVRPRSPVGVRYVDIVPGKSSTDLGEGEMIPSSQTSATTPLDSVLSTFDPVTRKRAQDMFSELGAGFVGRGEDLNQTLGATPAMLRDSKKVLGALADRPGRMRGFVRDSEGAVTAFDPVRRPLAEGFEPEAQALRPFADAADDIHATLEQAPPALDTLQSRLPRVDALVGEVRGFAANVRPALAVAPGAFRETSAMLSEARPGLRDAERTVDLAGRAVEPTVEWLDTTLPVLPTLDATFADGTPIVAKLGAHGCDIHAFGANWSSMMSQGSESGGVLRFRLVSPTAESLVGVGEAFEDTPLFAQNENPYPAPCEAGTEKLGG